MKKKTNIPTESTEKQSYKIRYLKRKIAEEEANGEIKDFTSGEDNKNLPTTPNVEEKRNLRLV